MADYNDDINRHYGTGDLPARILARLRDAGKDPGALTRDDLAAFDEFHTGGRESTRALARLAGLRDGAGNGRRVLDVGSGVGGPARTLAAEFGAGVVGLDLTEEFCRAAALLTDLVGASERVAFVHGDALAMPFGEGRFDVVWSQNTLMNIEDKRALFAEVARVTRPGGVFAFETVLAGRVAGVHYPTFWASSPALNFLVPPKEAVAMVEEAGFAVRRWEDITETTREKARRRAAASASAEPGARLGRDVIVPTDVREKIVNSLRNAEEGRTVAVQAICERSQ